MLDGTEKATDDLEKELHDVADTENPVLKAGSIHDAVDEVQEALWQRELLSLFVKNQIQASLALPLLALVFFATSLLWTNWALALGWLSLIFAAQGVQLFVCKMYQRSEQIPDNSTPDAPPHTYSVKDWIGMLVASEFLYAICWSVPLFVFWDVGNVAQHTITIATLMAVVAVRIIIASSYIPIIIAGTGLVTLNITIRCIVEAEPYYIGLGAMALLVEVFFIQLSRYLQKTTNDMLRFKTQREQLISKLEIATAEAEKGRQQAEIANIAKSRFLATMSHELRTPLNAIMGFSEILSEEMMGPHSVRIYKNYSGDILNSGDYLLSLINDILDLSRIEAGKHEIINTPVSLVDAVEDCSRLLQMKLKEKNQTLYIDLPEDMPKLLGDERAIRQIWINLLSNANKFSENDTTIKTAVSLLANNSLALTISDEGPGMTAVEIDNALGMFNRGERAEKKAIEGAGLGLAIVHGLIRLHDGDMHIKSTPGNGTTVIVTFPPARVLSESQEAFTQTLQSASPGQRALIAMTA